MLIDIVEARAVGDFRVFLRFEDGCAGELDLGKLIKFEGVFAPLRDAAKFHELFVNRELGTICWPNGADLDPDVLYAALSGKPFPVANSSLIAAEPESKTWT